MNSEKVAIVTGGTGAIGKAIAQGLAAQSWSVVLVARNENRAQQAVSEIIRATNNPNVSYDLADLSIPSAIEDLAKRWNGPLPLLINNAAVAPPRRVLSLEGLELQFATNILGYLRMQFAFHAILKETPFARVVNVASYWAGGLDLDDIQFQKRPYSNHDAYRQSKQANRMLTRATADLWCQDGIQVYACHPGDVGSTLSHDLGFGGSQSPTEGAATPVWLATNPDLPSHLNGAYFENKTAVPCSFSKNKGAVNKLLAYCMNFL